VFKVIRVVGNSMEPSYRSGDYVLVGTVRWLWRIRPGDAVVFRHARYGVLIKRVLAEETAEQQYVVEGTHAESTAPVDLGPAAFSSVIGRALCTFSRRRG
jgi:signal peptidase I